MEVYLVRHKPTGLWGQGRNLQLTDSQRRARKFLCAGYARSSISCNCMGSKINPVSDWEIVQFTIDVSSAKVVI